MHTCMVTNTHSSDIKVPIQLQYIVTVPIGFFNYLKIVEQTAVYLIQLHGFAGG